jgi:hypothetical protein
VTGPLHLFAADSIAAAGGTALAIEMGADAAGIGLTIHRHDAVGDVAMAAEAFEERSLYLLKRR